jgi:hypothetical protein
MTMALSSVVGYWMVLTEKVWKFWKSFKGYQVVSLIFGAFLIVVIAPYLPTDIAFWVVIPASILFTALFLDYAPNGTVDSGEYLVIRDGTVLQEGKKFNPLVTFSRFFAEQTFRFKSVTAKGVSTQHYVVAHIAPVAEFTAEQFAWIKSNSISCALAGILESHTTTLYHEGHESPEVIQKMLPKRVEPELSKLGFKLTGLALSVMTTCEA